MCISGESPPHILGIMPRRRCVKLQCLSHEWKLAGKVLMKRELSRCALSCPAVCTVFNCRWTYCVTCRLIDKFQSCVMGAGKNKIKRLDMSYCVVCVPYKESFVEDQSIMECSTRHQPKGCFILQNARSPSGDAEADVLDSQHSQHRFGGQDSKLCWMQ